MFLQFSPVVIALQGFIAISYCLTEFFVVSESAASQATRARSREFGWVSRPTTFVYSALHWCQPTDRSERRLCKISKHAAGPMILLIGNSLMRERERERQSLQSQGRVSTPSRSDLNQRFLPLLLGRKQRRARFETPLAGGTPRLLAYVCNPLLINFHRITYRCVISDGGSTIYERIPRCRSS